MKIKLEKVGPVTTVILNRPDQRNAIDRETSFELAKAFRAFEADEEAKVAVLYGEGGNFCAGADLKELASQGTEALPLYENGDGPLGPTRLRLSKPVLAAVSGYAVAGGLELAIWCDLRIIDETAVFGVFCRKWGIPLIDGGTVRLPRLIGQGRALDMILTGREVGPEEAIDIGLANRLVAKGSTRQEAEALALRIAQFPQICMRNDRRSTYDQFTLTETDALLNEFRLGMKSISSGELALDDWNK